MATATAREAPVQGNRKGSAAGLFVIAAVALLILPLLYLIYTNPAVRDLGFSNPDQIRNWLAALGALLILLSAYVFHKGHPSTLGAGAPAAAGGAAGSRGAPRAPSRATAALDDPMSRPGAAFAYEIPAVPADALEGGWRRYKFPAERTGGLYVDSDIVVDKMERLSEAGDATARGHYILRVRDEVARVCVRCDLLDHCHGAVARILTKQDMLANFECVPGLRKMAQAKLAVIKKAKEAPPPPPEPEPPAAPPVEASPATDPAAEGEAPPAPPPEPSDERPVD
jgi:hypothetical protein